MFTYYFFLFLCVLYISLIYLYMYICIYQSISDESTSSNLFYENYLSGVLCNKLVQSYLMHIMLSFYLLQTGSIFLGIFWIYWMLRICLFWKQDQSSYISYKVYNRQMYKQYKIWKRNFWKLETNYAMYICL